VPIHPLSPWCLPPLVRPSRPLSPGLCSGGDAYHRHVLTFVRPPTPRPSTPLRGGPSFQSTIHSIIQQNSSKVQPTHHFQKNQPQKPPPSGKPQRDSRFSNFILSLSLISSLNRTRRPPYHNNPNAGLVRVANELLNCSAFQR